MITVDFEGYNNTVNNSYGKLICVKFTAEWCIPCIKIRSLISRLEHEFESKVIFIEADFEKDERLAKLFKIQKIYGSEVR